MRRWCPGGCPGLIQRCPGRGPAGLLACDPAVSQPWPLWPRWCFGLRAGTVPAAVSRLVCRLVSRLVSPLVSRPVSRPVSGGYSPAGAPPLGKLCVRRDVRFGDMWDAQKRPCCHIRVYGAWVRVCWRTLGRPWTIRRNRYPTELPPSYPPDAPKIQCNLWPTKVALVVSGLSPTEQ